MRKENSSLDFFEMWNIYQKIIENNYMYHSEIIDIVKAEAFHMKAVSILDLGCGDSYIVTNAIAKKQISSYLGIDTSAAALQFSQANLAQHEGDIKHINGNFLDELKKINGSFELIIAGYSLHHLSNNEKEMFFSLAPNILSDNGVLIFYDIESNCGETPDQYNNRACAIFKKYWNKINETEIKRITEHVIKNDMPECEDFYIKNISRGFNNVEKTFRDKDCLFSLYILREPLSIPNVISQQC